MATLRQCRPRTVVSDTTAMPSSCSRIMISTFRRFSSASSRPGGRKRKQTMLIVVGATLSSSGSAAIRRVEILRLRDVLIDQASEFLDAVLLERHPDFQRAKSAARLQAVFVEPFGRRRARAAPVRDIPVSRRSSRDARPRRGPARSRPRTARAAICAGRARSNPPAPVRGRDRRSAARWRSSAPMQPSTCSQRPSRAARSASAGRSSIAPVLTVPGVGDHARRAESRRRDRARWRRASASRSMRRSAPARNAPQRADCPAPSPPSPCDGNCASGPSHRSAAASSIAATPCSRTSTPALTLRATISAIRFAIEPPLTKRAARRRPGSRPSPCTSSRPAGRAGRRHDCRRPGSSPGRRRENPPARR